ncbi:hypothetical protein BDN72DRAFT_850877 [Pluteus cervinus]|uniref:Uncharacterized protein n=1 Tax=Pluteus cervinus TaxID=181527 RepID=A0ACD3A336_9AGAR|nr:hypothetical protein BDN72DRAFT_850877 [Pluteus cervinus]
MPFVPPDNDVQMQILAIGASVSTTAAILLWKHVQARNEEFDRQEKKERRAKRRVAREKAEPKAQAD